MARALPRVVARSGAVNPTDPFLTSYQAGSLLEASRPCMNDGKFEVEPGWLRPEQFRIAVGQQTPGVLSQDLLLPPVTLSSGWLVSGTVIDPAQSPVADVNTLWKVAGTCDSVFTVRDWTDDTGRFELALAPGAYDVTLEPPPSSGLFPDRIFSVAVLDQDVVLPISTLGYTPVALERCNGIDDDCDGVTDEDFTDLASGCSVGLGACQADGLVVCSPDGSGTVCDAAHGSPGPETCDGVDNDCDGVADEVCAVPEPALVVDVESLAWNPLSDAVHYDVVRGNLSTLQASGLAGRHGVTGAGYGLLDPRPRKPGQWSGQLCICRTRSGHRRFAERLPLIEPVGASARVAFAPLAGCCLPAPWQPE